MTVGEAIFGGAWTLPGSGGRVDAAPAGADRRRGAPAPAPAPDTTASAGQDVAVVDAWTRPVRLVLTVLTVLALGVCFYLVLGSGIEHTAAQSSAMAQFNDELSQGTAPIRPTTAGGALLPAGTPIALLEIPALGVREVVGEGTTSAALIRGPGHERSTVFPGGTGTSVLMGRAAAFGGPFGRLADLRPGAVITVVTGVGTSTFRVVDVRTAGQLIPPLTAGEARLTLATAAGSPFFPSGVVWVDADATTPALAAARPPMATVPADELPLGSSPGAYWGVLLWLLVLVGVLAAAAWTWRRRGHAQAWIIFVAPLLVIGYSITGEVARVLPNLT